MHMLRSLSAVMSIMAATVAYAEELPAPTGEVLLTVSGAITNAQADGKAQFDLAMLEQLGTMQFETTTNWTEGTQVFEGVPVARILEAVGASGATLKATAINDYAVEAPVAEMQGEVPIIAFRRNGEAMSVRDKGPLWIVYPYDASAEYRTETTFSRSIWQLDRIEILE